VPRVELSARDALVLIYNVLVHDDQFGSMDAHRTTDMLLKDLSFKVRLPRPVVESALYCCNMLDEEKKSKFWHPLGITFDQYVDLILARGTFDKRYNFVREDGDVE